MPAYDVVMTHVLNSRCYESWIGSIQVLLVLSTGFLTGYGLDRGYLCVFNASFTQFSSLISLLLAMQ